MTKEVKKEEIISISKTVFEYFKKNKMYPKSILIKGTTYSIQEATYLMSAFITKQTDIKKISVGGASSPQGDRCNRIVKKKVYKDMAERLTKYIENNKRLPNYVTITDNQKCSIILFMLQLSKIVSAYTTDFPNEILINSNDLNKPVQSSLKKFGHATKSGCDNRGQNNSVNCGPHSVQEVIRNLTGKVIPQSQLASWAGTTSSGSSHNGLETAIAMAAKTLNVKLSVKWYNFNDLGWNGLKKIINSNNQDFLIHSLYRSQYGHYEVVNKIYNDYCDVQNSLGDKCNSGCYCGYVEERYLSTFLIYMAGISQKSIMVITRGE